MSGSSVELSWTHCVPCIAAGRPILPCFLYTSYDTETLLLLLKLFIWAAWFLFICYEKNGLTEMILFTNLMPSLNTVPTFLQVLLLKPINTMVCISVHIHVLCASIDSVTGVWDIQFNNAGSERANTKIVLYSAGITIFVADTHVIRDQPLHYSPPLHHWIIVNTTLLADPYTLKSARGSLSCW